MNEVLYNTITNAITLIFVFVVTVGTEFAVATWAWSAVNGKKESQGKSVKRSDARNTSTALSSKSLSSSSPSDDIDVTHHWIHWIVGFVNVCALMLVNAVIVEYSAMPSKTTNYFAPSAAYYSPIVIVAGVCFFLATFCFLRLINHREQERMSTEDRHGSADLEANTDLATRKNPNQPTGVLIMESEKGMVFSKEEEKPKKQPKGFVHYINNIKIFLTVMVLAFHVACTFYGDTAWGYSLVANDGITWGKSILYIFIRVGSSFCMSLFFFIAGYFTPKSFDRRGRWTFLLERYRRLGIPFVVTTFLLGPLISDGLTNLMFVGTFDMLPLNPGVTWFLFHLLIMSTIFAFACDRGWSPRVSYPGMTILLVVGLAVGAIGGVISIWLSDPKILLFLLVPDFWFQYPFYLAFFFTGGLAERNKWMDHLTIQNAGVSSRIAIYTLCLIILGLLVMEVVLSDKIDTWKTAHGNPFWFHVVLEVLRKSIGEYGLATVAWSLGVTFFFMDFVNHSFGWITRVMAQSMYTAYIIQFLLPIQTAFYIYVSIYNAANQDDPVVFSSTQKSAGIPGNLVFPSALFVFVVESIIVWPLACGIRSIPGFSRVL